jgi:hypothetical protein
MKKPNAPKCRLSETPGAGGLARESPRPRAADRLIQSLLIQSFLIQSPSKDGEPRAWICPPGVRGR